MTEKIQLKNTSWVIKVGVIGGWTVGIIYTFYLIVGFIQGLFA